MSKLWDIILIIENIYLFNFFSFRFEGVADEILHPTKETTLNSVSHGGVNA
jgi:hypothetical protein